MQNLDGTDFVELVLEAGDPAVGQSVRALAEQLPTECVLISVRRDGRVLIPNGNTVFEEGDRVTAFTATAARSALVNCLRGPEEDSPPGA